MKRPTKRLMSAALALALLSGTAASADPWHGPRGGHYDRYDRYDRGYRHHNDGAGAAVAVGVGLLALTAILAASERDRARTQPYADPPPPPSYPYRDDRDYRSYPQAEPDYDRYGPPNDPRDDSRYDRDGRYDRN